MHPSASSRLRVSVALPRPGDPASSPDDLQALARAIEDAGLDACSMDDHPFPALGPDRPGWHTFDPFVLLGHVAAATTTLRLHTNIVVLPYRNPFVMAKAAATLHHVAGGRLILGVGAGYLPAEFAALGVPFDQRDVLVDEHLGVLRRAWSGDPLDQVTPRWRADGNAMQPTADSAPIWMGGNSRRAMRRAVRHCDGWSPFQLPASYAAALHTAPLDDAAALGRRLAELRVLAGEAGRTSALDVCYVVADPTWTTRPEAALREELEELEAIGVTWISVTFPAAGIEERQDAVRAFGGLVAGPGLPARAV